MKYNTCFCGFQWVDERERKAHNREAHKIRQGQRLQIPKRPKNRPKIGKILIERSDRSDYISW